ncbi:MAG TPA: hypothetical protein VKB54_04575 [Solirubrobacteraceae bacterium]|nr:hypothetical protein [Solirubrobacteraceae bacterium]
MTTATEQVRSKTPEELKEDASLRYAMLSVYYRSLGSELESRGAPVMVVPPEVAPLPLDEALERLDVREDLLWDAYWRIVRSVPVEGWERQSFDRRYPPAFVERLEDIGPHELATLDRLRRHARVRAHLLTAALLACVEGRSDQALALADLLENESAAMLDDTDGDDAEGDPSAALNEGTKAILGRTAGDYMRWLARSKKSRGDTRKELRTLQAEVGLNLSDFVEDFFDAVAFESFKRRRKAPKTVLTASCIVRQDANTLTTNATVTTLVDAKFETLRDLIDPLNWSHGSTVIDETSYVAAPFDLSTVEYKSATRGFSEPRFLYERVSVDWGDDDLETGGFRNVLTIDNFEVDKRRGRITLPFKLCRSIDSRILWDSRPGGILIDGGYITARSIGEDRWRVTTRKILQFSDRTPYSNATGWLDYGQLLNFLTPAAVTWWLETDFYSAASMREIRIAPRRPKTQQQGDR